jgi:hypothetical protein
MKVSIVRAENLECKFGKKINLRIHKTTYKLTLFLWGVAGEKRKKERKKKST